MPFSFDAEQPVGARGQSMALIGDSRGPDPGLVEDGMVVDAAPAAIRMVPLSFPAGGGDAYPFADSAATDPGFANGVELAQAEDAPGSGATSLATDGSEQHVLAALDTADLDADVFVV